MNESTITRRSALTTLGGAIMAVAAAALPIVPSGQQVGRELTHADRAYRAAVLDVARALTERFKAASQRSTATGASFERLALDAYAAERDRAVTAYGADADAILGDALALQLQVLRQWQAA